MKKKAYLETGLICFFLWWVLALLLGKTYLPSPPLVFSALWRAVPNGLGLHLLTSLWRVAASMLLAVAAGVPLGMALGRGTRFNGLFSPFIYMTYPIPKIVLLPILLLFLGIGEGSKIALVFLTILYQIIVTTRDAASTVPKAALLSIKSLGCSGFQAYRHVVIPYCLPAIFTAIRLSTGTAIAVLFFSESFATNQGLGYLIMDSWGRADYATMYAGIVVMSAMGLAIYLLMDECQSLVCPWLRHC